MQYSSFWVPSALVPRISGVSGIPQLWHNFCSIIYFFSLFCFNRYCFVGFNATYGILHEWNQDHDCKNGGHDESFNDDDGPVHSKSLVYNSLWIVQVLELYRNQNYGNDGNGKTEIIFPGQFFFEKKPTDEGGETDNTNVVNGE